MEVDFQKRSLIFFYLNAEGTSHQTFWPIICNLGFIHLIGAFIQSNKEQLE